MRLLPAVLVVLTLPHLCAQDPGGIAADEVSFEMRAPDEGKLISGAATKFTFGLRCRLSSRSRADLKLAAYDADGQALPSLTKTCGTVDLNAQPTDRGRLLRKSCQVEYQIPDVAGLAIRAVLVDPDGTELAHSAAAAYTVARALADLRLQMPDILIEGQAAKDYPEPLKATVTWEAPDIPRDLQVQVEAHGVSVLHGGVPFPGSIIPVQSSVFRGTDEIPFPDDFAASGTFMRFRARYQLPDSDVWVESAWIVRQVVWVRGSTASAGPRAGVRTRVNLTASFNAGDSSRQLACIARYSNAGSVLSWQTVPIDGSLRNGTESRDVNCDLEAPPDLARVDLWLANAPAPFDFSTCPVAQRPQCPGVAIFQVDLPVQASLSLDLARTGLAAGAGATLSRASGGPASTIAVSSAPGNLASVGVPTAVSKAPAAGGAPVSPKLPDFLAINRVWRFDPAVPESSGFQADLTFEYLPGDLPDDPGFDESRLTLVSYDPITGAVRAWPTTLDRASRRATARISGLASVYTLGVYGPFHRRFWNFPAVLNGGGLQTALTFVNLGTSAVNLAATSFNNAGKALNSPPAAVRLPTGRQWTGLATDVAAGTGFQSAWIQAASDQPEVLSLAWLGGRYGAAALPAPPLYATSQLLPEIEWSPGVETRILVANPTAFAAAVTIDLLDAQGARAGSGSFAVPAKGSVTVDASSLFATALPESFTGYARVYGNQELATAQAVSTALAVAALPGRTGAAMRLFGPHADARDVGARLTLVNTGTAAAHIAARLVKDDGTAAAPPATLTVDAGRQSQRTVASIFGLSPSDDVTGALVLESDTTTVSATLTHLDSSGLATRASIALDTEPGRSAVLPQFANAGGLATWIAIQNTTSTAAAAQVRVYALDGTRAGLATLRIPAGGRVAAELSKVVAESARMATGYILIDSDQPVVAMGWVVSAANPMMAALPAQRLYTPSSSPAAAGPSLALSAASLDFGSVTVGQTSDRDIVLRNTGTAALEVSALETVSPFRVVSPAAPFTIPAGGSSTAVVRFAPSSAGAQSGSLSVLSNDPRNSRATVALSGAGASATPAGTPLTVSPSILEFDSVAINTTRERTVTVVNPGTSTAQVVSVASNNPAFAAVSSALPFTVGAGGQATLTIRFAPTAAGSQSGILTIVTTTGSLTVTAVGIGTAGTAGARITVSPAALDFGNVQAGSTRDQNLGVSNIGTAALEVTSISTSNGLFSVVSPAPPFTVNPGVVTTVVVRFSPTAAGDQSGVLNLASSGGAMAVNLTGSGTPLVVTTLFSDSFERESSIACELGAADNAFGGNLIVYYHPLYRYPIADRIVAVGAEVLRGALRNPGNDFAGVQFSGTENACSGGAASTFRQDFTLKMDITLPPGSDPSYVTQAGPFFRSRTHELGAVLVSDQSAGFWLQLHSTGQLTLKRLATNEIIASTPKPAAFDGRSRHALEITVSGSSLQATLDGATVRFDRGAVITLPVEPGNPSGAGIAFAAEEFRVLAGGQSVDNLVVTTPRPLTGTM